ncbi:MAG: hypothetical protein E5299_00768 [Burkholderia gladioli]|nr:MAG: hypothetical protein E5299_00768 [Burkholderia gladioli]
MRADADKIKQAAHLFNLNFFAWYVDLFTALVGKRAQHFAGQGFGQPDPVVRVVTLLEPNAGRAFAARRAVGQRQLT